VSARAKLSHDWFPRPVPENVIFGKRTWCYSSFAFVHYRSVQPCGVRIGDDSGIYDGTFFDLGPEGRVEIGNYCAIVGAIISSNDSVVIDDYTFIAHQVVIADCPAARPRDGAEWSDPDKRGKNTARDIWIGANAWIGARAVLLAGARIGAGSIIGAGAVVDFEVPEYSLVAGNPAKVLSTVGDDVISS